WSNRAGRSGQGKDEDAISALEIELCVTAAPHRNVLLVVDHVGDRHGVGASTTLELPQKGPASRVERFDEPAALTEKEQTPRCREPAADKRLLRVVLPDNLAGVDIDRGYTAPLLFTRDSLERAAEPEFPIRILRRFDVIRHRLMQVE